MKKEVKRNKLLYIIIILIILIMISFVLYSYKPSITGKATGITISNPISYGLTSSQKLVIGGDITKKLCAGAYTTETAALVTDAVNKYNGGIKGAIMDGLGIPSTELPDVYGILASVANWLNQNPSTKCLKDIGKTACGKDWTGTLYVAFDRGKGSALYPSWEYYYERVKYVGQGIDCEATLGCAFSYNPNTKDISKSCFG